MRNHALASLKPGRNPVSFLWAFVLLGMLVLSACRSVGSETPAAQGTATFTAAASPPVTQTATPQHVLLVVPEGIGGLASDRIRTAVDQLASGTGLLVEEQTSLPAQIDGEYALAIMLYPDQAFLEAARANADLAFVAIAALDFPAETNLWVIGNQGTGMESASFLAGYIAAMITPEWRTGAIESFDSWSGMQLDQAFVNGGAFFCGLCRPKYPPFYTYPASLAMNSLDESAALTVISTIEEMDLSTVWASYEVLQILSRFDLPGRTSFLGESRPADFRQEAWIAAVRPAPEQRLAELWGLIRSGAPAEQVGIPIVIEDINPSILTPGKLELARRVGDELAAGYIDTGAGGE
jgi:hypothetical protein